MFFNDPVWHRAMGNDFDGTVIDLFGQCVFDIKDIHGDRVHGIKTLPNTIGIERTRYLLYILNTLFGLFLLLVISE